MTAYQRKIVEPFTDWQYRACVGGPHMRGDWHCPDCERSCAAKERLSRPTHRGRSPWRRILRRSAPDKLPRPRLQPHRLPASTTTDSVGEIALLPMRRLRWRIGSSILLARSPRRWLRKRQRRLSAKPSKEEEFGHFYNERLPHILQSVNPGPIFASSRPQGSLTPFR